MMEIPGIMREIVARYREMMEARKAD